MENMAGEKKFCKKCFVGAVVCLFAIAAVLASFLTYLISSRAPETSQTPDQEMLPSATADGKMKDSGSFVLDGSLEEWKDLPPTFELSPDKSESKGLVWVGQTEDGIAIAGEASVSDYQVALTTSFVQPELPPIGWGHQFGLMTLESQETCEEGNPQGFTIGDLEECKKWYQNQVQYRELFQKLFARGWSATPNRVEETHAAKAYGDIQILFEKQGVSFFNYNKEVIANLKSHESLPSAQFEESSFEVFIPWDALPPLNSLTLEDIDISVGVQTENENLLAQGVVRFPQVRTYRITSCNYNLEGEEFFGDPTSAYFLPTREGVVFNTFIVENSVRGYQYGPESPSPVITETKYFEQRLPSGEIICGPALTFSKEALSQRSKFELQEDFEARKLPSGSLLIKNGPYDTPLSRLGSGACGACSVRNIEMYIVKQDSTIHKILDVEKLTQQSLDFFDAEIQVSEEWREITVFEIGYASDSFAEERKAWEKFCFQEASETYVKCGEFTPSL